MVPGAIRGVGNAAAKFLEGTTLADRVVGQMNLGDNHAFPASVDTFAARYGTASTVLDSRGNPVQMLTVDGAYHGAKGTFEYIKTKRVRFIIDFLIRTKYERRRFFFYDESWSEPKK